ncbi:19216_t:CDS:1, partial [Funneliformis geosporum]
IVDHVNSDLDISKDEFIRVFLTCVYNLISTIGPEHGYMTSEPSNCLFALKLG